MKFPLLMASLALTFGCEGSEDPHATTAKFDPHNPCSEYIAAYDNCLSKLGPEAKAIGEKNLAAATEQIKRGANDVSAQARCRQAKAQIETACR
jgi:hypothetical protein